MGGPARAAFEFGALFGGGLEGQHHFDGIAHEPGHDKDNTVTPGSPPHPERYAEKITAHDRQSVAPWPVNRPDRGPAG